MHKHSPGPEGGVENRGRRPRFLTPKEPGECKCIEETCSIAIIAQKTEYICYISRYFLHYFVLPFYRCLANAISMDYMLVLGPGSIYIS